MEFVAWLAMGLSAGLFAQFVLMDEWRGGLFGNLLFGAAGALLAGLIMRFLGTAAASEVNLWTLALAFIGAGMFLWAGRAATARKALN